MFVNMSVERASASGKLIMTQSYSRSAYCAHCPKTFSFELYGEKIDPNLSQSQSREKEKVEDHYLCSNHNSIIPCNINGRVYSFELSGEKIDPNIDLRNKQEKEDDHGINGNTLRRSISMEILDACNNEPDFMDDGDLPDGVHNGSSHYIHDKKKGSIWTTDEHKLFLLGLDKLGKGDWRGISKKYVQTRTPTQVASHAQKYFIRMKAREKGKRRSSLFDMPKEPMRYGNNRNEHKSNNPECSTMVPFGPIMSKFYPFGSNQTQRISQTPFMTQHLAITHESSRAGASTSTSKEDVV